MNEERETINSEQAADFAALQATANDAPALPGEVKEKPPVDVQKDIVSLLTIGATLLGKIFPSIVEIYTPEVIKEVGTVIAEVCKKRNWIQGGLTGNFGEEMACVMVLAPLALATYSAIQIDIAKRKKPEPARIAPTFSAGAVLAPDAPPSTAGQAVTFGAPVTSVEGVPA